MVLGDARPEKESFLLVAFSYGANAATKALYTDFDEDFLGHTSEPRMAVEPAENTGTFDKNETRILLPLDSFTDRASSGVPHSPIYVRIEEWSRGLYVGDQNAVRVLMAGRVVRTIRNFQGKPGTIAFFALPIKSRLDIPLGLPCNHHCAWALFKGGCGANEASYEETTQIDSVDGHEVTITDTDITTPGTADPRYWKRGYLEKDGLRIAIRDYDGSVDATKLYMTRRVPDDWVGGSGDIRAVPGCDKTIETCRSRYNQEETFMGLGYAIPAYNPIYQSPQ